MCDNDFVMCDVPKASIDMVITAWNDFKRDPGDYNKYRALDWIFNVAFAKWQSYSDVRRSSGA